MVDRWTNCPFLTIFGPPMTGTSHTKKSPTTACSCIHLLSEPKMGSTSSDGDTELPLPPKQTFLGDG